MHAGLHNVTRVEAKRYQGSTWLHLEDKYGNYVSVFIPFNQALAMQDAFISYQPKPKEGPKNGEEVSVPAV